MKDAKRGPARPKRTRLNPQQREEEIVAGAVLYFSEVGFGGGMRDLAARLGISHALLFRYFPSKEALVDRVYDRIFLGRWNPAWDALLDDRGLNVSERLARFYTAYLQAIDNPAWVRTFMFAGLAGVNINQRYLKLIRRKVIEPVARELGRLTGGGGQNASAGQDADAAPPSEAALELSWGLHGEIFYFAIRRRVYGVKVGTELEAYVTLVVRKFLEGAPAALGMSGGRR